ncbi:RNAse [Fulvitalea axinellae]|uniref:RNAse n=1 Tax=Fulvitalea axinellae TaxID=1182444 RepID=A0AAU9CIC8_9BACT|nr:RNAse [Fulvitalea axinellae]
MINSTAPVLDRNMFFVKEHVGMFKAANNFDIHDPETNEILLECREDDLGFFTKMLRFTDYKRMTPFNVEIKEPNGKTLIRVSRGVSFFRSVVEVFDENNTLIGKFRQRMLSIGGKFDVLTPDDQVICQLKGKWSSWEFRFEKEGNELAMVSKKWAGIGKELFTTADNYMLTINDNVPSGHVARKLILAAVMCIDMVLKE